MRSLPRITLSFAMALASITSGTPARAAPRGPTGFAVEVRITAPELPASGILMVGGSSLPPSTSDVFVGYRFSALTIGLGAGFSRLSLDQGGALHSEVVSLRLAPTLMLPLWRDPQGSTEVFLTAAIAFGHWSATTDAGVGSRSEVDGVLVGGDLGLGGNVFVARTLGLGLEAGLLGSATSGQYDQAGGHNSSDGAMVGLYGVLTATLVIGSSAASGS
jgi:hypothetical protein